MKINDKINGFKLISTTIINELNAKMHLMEFEKNGAKLLWLERDEKNKTFAITYKTIPEDDTGVFHILEHSVLNGSQKYPVKEPFVELLKGSLNTFLNAMTFSDKTMYPVSSMNEKDFLNLVDVYMDAVLHPIIYDKPEIFWQEGWHYEYFGNENEQPTFKGVVFNEMKGVYSSVDSIIESELNRLLYPDNCYGCESGGHPDAIPSLTYEQFLNAHRKFYHPSNAKIFLDGDLDFQAVSALLEKYLGDYDAQIADFPIPMQKPIPYTEETKEFEIPATDDPTGKSQFAIGYVIGEYHEQEKLMAMRILFDYLCGSNESPLKKAVISSGLAEEIEIGFIDDHAKQISAIILVKNFKADDLDKIKNIINETLTKIAQNGLDREQLIASFNNYEFKARERDFGTYPAGVYYAMYVMKSWLHDDDPAMYLKLDDAFKSLREQLDGDYFVSLIENLFLKSNHKALILMKPSTSLGEEKVEREKEKLSLAKSSWKSSDESEIVELNHKLKIYQESEDSAEEVAKIPTIQLSDIDENPVKLPLEIKNIDSSEILFHEVSTGGISYADLYFSANGLNADELSCASLLAEIITEMGTKKFSSYELNKEIKTHIGRLEVNTEAFAKPNDLENCNSFITVSCSVLEQNKAKAIEILDEILNNSIFESKQIVLDFIKQIKLRMEQYLVSAGHIQSMTRVNAYITSVGAVKEYFTGFEFYTWLKNLLSDFENRSDNLINQLDSLKNKIFTRENLTISLTGKYDDDFVNSLINITKKSDKPRQNNIIKPMGIRQEGIVVPADISFASTGSNLFKVGTELTGEMRVAVKALSLGYLWNSIRVQGGAYGAGLLARFDGTATYYSYRDPNANNSLEVYSKANNFIREFCENSDADTIAKYIIGTISTAEPILSNKLIGKVSATNYLSGIDYDLICKNRKEILNTNKESLLKIIPYLKKISDENAICVIGSNEIIKACGDKLSSILHM